MSDSSIKVEMGWMPLSPLTASQCAKLAVSRHRLRGTASMKEATIIGVDLAKNVLQLHGAAADGSVVFRKKLSRMQFARFIRPCELDSFASLKVNYIRRSTGISGDSTGTKPP